MAELDFVRLKIDFVVGKLESGAEGGSDFFLPVSPFEFEFSSLDFHLARIGAAVGVCDFLSVRASVWRAFPFLGQFRRKENRKREREGDSFTLSSGIRLLHVCKKWFRRPGRSGTAARRPKRVYFSSPLPQNEINGRKFVTQCGYFLHSQFSLSAAANFR